MSSILSGDAHGRLATPIAARLLPWKKLVKTYPTEKVIFAGLRRSECVWLRKLDVDLGARTIRVCSKEDKGGLWTAKTNADRQVPISSDLMRFLGRYEPREDSIWYFASPRGRRWDADNFSHELSRLQRKYGQGRLVDGELKPYGCNVFRHTFATRLATRGKSLAQIAKLMGNSVAICERHYGAFVTGEMRDVVESEDKTVKVWDAETGGVLLTLTGHGFAVMSVSFSPDGRRLASGSWDRPVKVWNAETGTEFVSCAPARAAIPSASSGRRQA